MARVIVGTAGHIDHGKSTLVRVLTGTDPDRLPEEKRRKITIDLGFAFLEDVAAIIDVPGHEKFVHNMVAGASTIDFAILVVAADDGVMPQTREHLYILQFLGVRFGTIVITKSDVVESEWRELVKEQVRSVVRDTFLAHSEINEIDSLSGRGIQEFRSFLIRSLRNLPSKRTSGTLRIPIDRVFKVHGYGTVVTGTVLSGKVESDQHVELLPGGYSARVKNLQSNAKGFHNLLAGMRAALNLNTEILPVRGQTITDPGSMIASKRLSVQLQQVPGSTALRDRQRIRLLIGTQEVMGRYRELADVGGTKFALLILEDFVVAAWHDHFVLRRYSPVETLGGGIVLELDPSLRTTRRSELTISRLKSLAVEDVSAALCAWLRYNAPKSITCQQLSQHFGMTASETQELLRMRAPEIILHGAFALHSQILDSWKDLLKGRLRDLHTTQPGESDFALANISAPLAFPDTTLVEFTLDVLVRERHVIKSSSRYRLASAKRLVDDDLESLTLEVVELLAKERFAPSSARVISGILDKPQGRVEKALVIAAKSGTLIRLGTDMFFESTAFHDAVQLVTKLLSAKGSIQVSDLTKELGSSRKYVVPFLEYLDSIGITERRESTRVRGRHFSTKVENEKANTDNT